MRRPKRIDGMSPLSTALRTVGSDTPSKPATSATLYVRSANSQDFHHDGSFLPPLPALMISTAAAATQWFFWLPV